MTQMSKSERSMRFIAHAAMQAGLRVDCIAKPHDSNQIACYVIYINDDYIILTTQSTPKPMYTMVVPDGVRVCGSAIKTVVNLLRRQQYKAADAALKVRRLPTGGSFGRKKIR